MPKQRVVVGLSGGVDSSVTALLLKEQGFDVVGLFMKNWEDDDTDEYCSSKQDLLDAVAVADRLDIDIEAVNFAKEYKERVFSYFLTEYAAGRTPNPDILCNSEIKFKSFLEHAINLGADWIATGHYARVRERDGRFELLKGCDPAKDQSYFLCRLNQAQLAKTLFPLGELRKTEVRALARAAGLITHAKKDSTGICFIGERPFRDFLARYLPKTPGDMVTPDGQRIGQHQGLAYYTIGQRQGLGIGGAGEPWFVSGKNMTTNTLYVVQGHDHPALLTSRACAAQLSWTLGEAPAAGRHLAAKTRYRQPDAPGVFEGSDGVTCAMTFETPQWAVTPGQSLVLYDGDICLGGGILENVPL